MCGGSNVCLQTLTAPPAQDKEYISPGGLAGHAQCPAVSPSDLVQNKIRDITVITDQSRGGQHGVQCVQGDCAELEQGSRRYLPAQI